MPNMEVLRELVALQTLVTFFLVALFLTLHKRLHQERFFLWWAWAWTAYGVSRLASWLSLEHGSEWTTVRAIWVLVSILASFVQIPLLLCGARSLTRRCSPRDRATRILIGLSLAAGGGSFILFQLLEDPYISYLARSVPRHLGLALAYFFCGWAFSRWYRSRKSVGLGITAVACLLYGANYAILAVELLPGVPLTGLPLRFLDLVYECGIAFGMILLLLEEFQTQRSRLDLYEHIVPTCCVCGKVRDDEVADSGEGNWSRLEHYVSRHYSTQWSHTFCPTCLKEFRRNQGLSPEDPRLT